jgi:hypothetical protein
MVTPPRFENPKRFNTDPRFKKSLRYATSPYAFALDMLTDSQKAEVSRFGTYNASSPAKTAKTSIRGTSTSGLLPSPDITHPSGLTPPKWGSNRPGWTQVSPGVYQQIPGYIPIYKPAPQPSIMPQRVK